MLSLRIFHTFLHTLFYSNRRLFTSLMVGGLVLSLSGCDLIRALFQNLEEEVHILTPVKTAGVHHNERENYGICHTRLESRIIPSHLRGTFDSANDPELLGVVGHEIRVARGETCHLRVATHFQTAIEFDLSELPDGAVSKAVLVFGGRSDYGLNPPVNYGGVQCDNTNQYVERATQSWESPPPLMSEDPDVPDRPAMIRELIPTEPLRPAMALFPSGDRNVTRTVRSWFDDEFPNFGFVLTSDTEQVSTQAQDVTELNDQFMCGMFPMDAQLEVTMLVRR